MRVLAVNTAAARLSLALAEGESGTAARVLFEAEVDEPRDQGNYMLQAITDWLAAQNIAFADLDLMLAVTGPGSFTGIRIGLAAMHGFALAADVELAGITSFALYAAAVPVATRHRLCVMESWREELYFQLDDGEPFNVAPAQAMAMLQARGITAADITFLGDAAAKMAALLPQAKIDSAQPNAADAARLAISQPALRGAPEPFYLRPADVTLAPGGRHLAATPEQGGQA